MLQSFTSPRIKDPIRKKGYKQGAIAERAGYTPETFGDMLNGRKLIMDYDLCKIIKTLGVTPNELFGFDDHPQKTA